MPEFIILTNVPKGKVPANFVEVATQLMVDQLQKPKEYISVSIIPDVLMGFGGTTEPCAQVHLTSIGKLGEEENKKISQGIAVFMQTHLGVPSDRFYIEFNDAARADIGFKGTTFAELSKK